MADLADEAGYRMECEQQRFLQGVSNQLARRELEPKGSCHWCGESFGGPDDPRLFCDKECAQDHHRHKTSRG
jgi:hypothetical protein